MILVTFCSHLAARWPARLAAGCGVLLCLLAALPAAAQRAVSGQVVEAKTGAPVPFASVFVPRTTVGATADAEGKFQLTVGSAADSVAASALGFAVGRSALTAAATQTVVIRLKAGAGVALGEVFVSSRQPENPAFRILREVQKHKPENATRTLTAAEFDSYNRTEVSMKDLPKLMANRKVVKDLRALAERRGASAVADPNAPLPLFAAEVSSRVYQQFAPSRRREDILHRQMRGPGPGENSLLSQLLGGNLQAFDFYPNWQNLLGKDFISPIAEGGRITYEYELQDSVFVGKDWCYKIGVTPKRAHDLAFTGTIWITAGSYALRRIDVVASKEANLNFVTELRISQDLTPPDQGPSLSARSQFMIGVRPHKGQAALQVRCTTVNSHFVRNQPHTGDFYDASASAENGLVTAPDAPVVDSTGRVLGYFDQHRPDTLDLAGSQTFAVLDSAMQLPSVRNIFDWIELFVNGYKRMGKLDFGPIANSYAYNDVEGNRFQLGFRTSPAISRTWLTQGYVAYGTRDGRLKYSLQTRYLAERRHWTAFGVAYRHDLDRAAMLDNDFLAGNNLFAAASQWGNFQRSRPILRDLITLSVQRDLFHGFTQKLLLRYQQLQPQYNFAYYTDTNQPRDTNASLDNDFNLSEIVLESRYARDENLVQGPINRVAVGIRRWPVFTFRYTLGVNRVLQSDFKYHKFNLLVTQSVGLGHLGRLTYRLEGNYIPSALPYPGLKIPLGNETPFLNPNAFNLMRYFEFVTDRSVSLRLEQHLEGLFLNAVPILRALDWRLVASANVLYGGLSATNRNLLPPTDLDGNPLDRAQSLGTLPYTEVGYGIENIFKFVRVDFLHRLTYRDLPNANNFGVKMTMQFRL